MRVAIFVLFFVLLMAFMLSLNVNGLSAASDYLENSTMVLAQGASKIYSIRLQNPTDYEASVKIDYDSELMKAIDYKEVYVLPPMTTGYRVEFNVTAPKKPGLYKITYTISEFETQAGGGLSIMLKINKGFNLRVVEEQNKPRINHGFRIGYGFAAFAIVAAALLPYVLWKSRKPSKRAKSRK